MRLIPQAWTTERLRIRRYAPGDAPFVLALHQTQDVVRFAPQAAMVSLDEAHAWIAGSVTGLGRGRWCVARHDGTPVASLSLDACPASAGHDDEDVELAWLVDPAHAEDGYVLEAARAVLASALASGLPRVIAAVHPDDLAAQRIAILLGMQAQGLSDAHRDATLEVYHATRPVPVSRFGAGSNPFGEALPALIAG